MIHEKTLRINRISFFLCDINDDQLITRYWLISAINKVFTKLQDSAINQHGRSSNITKLNHQRHGLKQNKTWDPKDLLTNEEMKKKIVSSPS